MKKPLGIRFYLVLSNVCLIVLTLGAAGSIWSKEQEDSIELALQDEVRKRALLLAALIARNLAEQPTADLNSLILPEESIEDNMTAVFVSTDLNIRNLSERPYPTTQTTFIAEYSQTALNGKSITAEIYSRDRPPKESIYAAVPVKDTAGNVLGAVCLILPLDPLEQNFTHIRTTFYEVAAGAALFGFLTSFFLAIAISRRIAEAKRLVGMVADGDYHQRLPESGPREFRELAGYLNRMAEELEEQTRQRQTLLANVTHELARPLGGLRLGVESLQGGAIEDSVLANDLLASMAETIQRMESLLEDITLAAYPKTRPIVLNRKGIDLIPFLQGLAARFRPAAAIRNVKITLDLPPKLPAIEADEKRLNQIMGNLIDNALKFSLREKQVKISAEKHGKDLIRLMVHDGGYGISAEDAPYLFSPFYQGHTGKLIRQGMGLGLVIARQLAEIHGGTLELVNHAEGGAVAILTLPIHADQANKIPPADA